MTKPISKSKRQLAQLLIEAGVTQFPEGANWAAQDSDRDYYSRRICFYRAKPTIKKGCSRWLTAVHNVPACVTPDTLIPNWHQTVLSRDEFDQIVAETVLPSETKVPSEKTKAALAEAADPAPTLDQLLQDWRNADDYALRTQAEADEAAAMRDERWQAVQDRAGELGVTVGRREPELMITDWLDLLVGDIVECIEPAGGYVVPGSIGEIIDISESLTTINFPEQYGYNYMKSHFERGCFKFIRRP